IRKYRDDKGLDGVGLLPPLVAVKYQRRRPEVNDRRVLNGIFWVLRSGGDFKVMFDLIQREFKGREFKDAEARKISRATVPADRAVAGIAASGLPLAAPPTAAEKATTRQDQARKTSTGEGRRARTPPPPLASGKAQDAICDRRGRKTRCSAYTPQWEWSCFCVLQGTP